MTDRLIRWLGLSDRIPEGAEAHFEWGNLPRGESGLFALACLAALVLLTVWLYRREGRASAWRKGGLAGLRLMAFGAVALVLLEPRLAIDVRETTHGHTVVLWDASLSMTLADPYQEEARRAALAEAAGLANPADVGALQRHELAWKIVDRARLFPGLEARNQLLVYAFDQEVRRLAGPPTPEELAPKGPATDLGAAVRRALEETGGRGVAAVVAVTDGKINRGEGAQGVVAALRRRGVPFYALGVGDPIPPRDLEVVDVAAEPRAMLGDPIVIEATVRARGAEGQRLEAVLVSRARDGGGTDLELERRTIDAPADGEAVHLTFTHAPTAAGEYVFELRLPPFPDEAVIDDNQDSATVTVSDDVSRVLLVAGSPTFEYHFLKTRLVRERTANVSCWLQSAQPRFPQEGDERIEALPTTMEELKAFDAIVLLDPDPEQLDAGTAEALKTFVAEHKGGVMFVAGPKYTASLLARPDLKPLRDVLPVSLGELVDERATEAWPLRATVDGADHPATRLEPDPERCRWLWSRLPSLFFSYPVQHEKAGATVLVRHEDPATMSDRGGRPFVVAHYFGGGPVLFMGSEETWRWRSVGARVYDRFWVGAMRFLVQGRLGGGRRRVELLTDKDEYPLGEPIRVRAHAVDRSYQPLVRAEGLRVQGQVGAETFEEVLLPAAQAGWFEGTILPPAQGVLELTLPIPDDDPGARPASKSVTVRLPDVEFADPVLDERTLASIAAETSGALVAPKEVAGLAERIPSLTEHTLSARAPIPLWDRWETIALIAALLGLEWAIRKRSRMV